MLLLLLLLMMMMSLANATQCVYFTQYAMPMPKSCNPCIILSSQRPHLDLVIIIIIHPLPITLDIH